MWRLFSLLAVLGFLEMLVPWPDVAALVLSSTRPPEARVAAPRPMTALERGREFLVQVRGGAPE